MDSSPSVNAIHFDILQPVNINISYRFLELLKFRIFSPSTTPYDFLNDVLIKNNVGSDMNVTLSEMTEINTSKNLHKHIIKRDSIYLSSQEDVRKVSLSSANVVGVITIDSLKGQKLHPKTGEIVSVTYESKASLVLNEDSSTIIINLCIEHVFLTLQSVLDHQVLLATVSMSPLSATFTSGIQFENTTSFPLQIRLKQHSLQKEFSINIDKMTTISLPFQCSLGDYSIEIVPSCFCPSKPLMASSLSSNQQIVNCEIVPEGSLIALSTSWNASISVFFFFKGRFIITIVEKNNGYFQNTQTVEKDSLVPF